MRVLLLDDNAINRELVELLLDEAGHAVDSVCDGASFRRYLAGSAVPDVLLMDIRLPDCSGVELLREARAVERLEGVPAIALTAHARGEDQRQFEADGFETVITKPIDTRSFVALVERVARRRLNIGKE